MLNRSAIWTESTKTKVPLPLVENQFYYAAFIIQFRKAPTMYSRSTLCWENWLVKGTKTTFSILFYALMMHVLRRICWCFHNFRETRGRVAKFLFFLLQISSELRILEHNIKKRIVSSASISSNFASKAKKCTNLTYVQIHAFWRSNVSWAYLQDKNCRNQ